ncbi:MAG: stage II sporulation protein M [bacterium]|nr:stage II sporulation protein M [bacterium]
MHFSRDISVKNLLMIIFFCFFFVGIITANIIDTNVTNDNGVLTRYYLKQLEYSTWNSNELLVYVAGFRGVLFLSLLLLGILCKGYLIHYLFVAWNGFSYGYFCVATICGFGLYGLLFCIASVIPQFLVYVPVYLYLIGLTNVRRKEVKLSWFGKLFFLIVLLLLGILLESYINPTILKKILHNI